MDIRELKYFVRVAKDENYSTAASRLYISQPALSKVIRKIEEEVGFELFYTFQKRQKLTDRGQLLYEKALRVINEYDSITEHTKLEKTIYQGRVFVGFPVVAGSFFLSRLLVDFSRIHPGIHLTTFERGTQRVMDDIESSALDVGFCIAPVPEEKFNSTIIQRDENFIVVNKAHPLADKSVVDLEDLAGQAFILHDADFAMHHEFKAACNTAGFSPHIVMRSANWEFILQMVRLNYGISMLPKCIFNRYSFPDVSILKINAPIRYCSIAMITKKDAYQPRSVECFCNYVRSNIHTITNTPADQLIAPIS